jgi:UDP-N-acetylmuramoylalanine--D-glutamate ligase
VRHAVLIGVAAPALGAAFERAGIGVLTRPSLAEALAAARDHARAGEVVLLSPACASFDMFDNFEHRGQVFKDLVAGLR